MHVPFILIVVLQNVDQLAVLHVTGTVVESSDWSLLSFGAIPELFWGAVEFVSLL